MIITNMSVAQIMCLVGVAIIFTIILISMIVKKFKKKSKQESQKEEIIIGKGDDQDEIRRNKH